MGILNDIDFDILKDIKFDLKQVLVMRYTMLVDVV